MTENSKEDLAIELLLGGKSATEVARDGRIDVHRSTVSRWAKKRGIELPPYNRHVFRDDLVDTSEIVRLRRREMEGRPMFTHQDIAGVVGCSTSYVKKVLAKSRKDHVDPAPTEEEPPSSK